MQDGVFLEVSVVLLFALKVNKRYWVHFYKQNAYWAFFLLHEKNTAPYVDAIQRMKRIICHHESNNCDSSTSNSHNTTCTKRELFNINPSHNNINMKRNGCMNILEGCQNKRPLWRRLKMGMVEVCRSVRSGRPSHHWQ